MKTVRKSNDQGFGHVVLFIIIAAVLALVGFAAWRILKKDKKETATSNSSTTQLSSSEAKKLQSDCEKETNDKDICKFIVSWKDMKKFQVVASDTSEGKTTKMTVRIDGSNTYMKAEGEMAYEMITIDKSTYTKGGRTWWKQTTKTSDTAPTVSASDYEFDEPTSTEAEAAKTIYQKQGKEACGSLTCFKYKIVDPANTSSTDYIWFDDKSYLLRKMRNESTDGAVSEQTFSYENISVTVPSPVKELGENQYLIPGESEPTTLPSASDFTE